MQADPRRIYDSTLAIKGGSCIFGCFGAGEASGLPPTGRGTELAEQLVIH